LQRRWSPHEFFWTLGEKLPPLSHPRPNRSDSGERESEGPQRVALRCWHPVAKRTLAGTQENGRRQLQLGGEADIEIEDVRFNRDDLASWP